MSDVRALLKAKRQEVRVTHPYAAYSERGALRCSVCGTGVKHAEAWEGHIGSKAHRMAVMRLKEEERRRQEEARAEEERKRKAEEEEEEEEEQEDGREAKRQRTEEQEEGGGTGVRDGFPADFFSDPSRAPPPRELDEEEEGGEQPAAPPPQKTAIDEEWEAFQRTVLNAPNEAEYEAKETYERATVFAEAHMIDVAEGMPPAEEQEAEVKDEKLSAEEERKRKQQEDRELIMDRLLEEERAQEEADSRVSLLKAKLDMLKKQRELAKAKKMART